MKVSMAVETMDAADLAYYAEACGWALALAHARSGDAAMIAGYVGSNDSFDEAITRFADDYADQTERDYAALRKAVKVGRIKAAAV
jgi:NAD(P)H-dependent flavin oxidoreductase YrpB (nitropropane dioxygenase family)